MDEIDRLVRRLTPEDRRVIAFLDLQRLQVENARRKFQATKPTYGVLDRLRFWSILAGHMEDDWQGLDHYMVYEYLNDLTVRDGIEEVLDAMPPGLRAKVRVCLDELDRRYQAVTHDDGGAELAQYWRPLAEGEETRWWWTRRPDVLPPGW
ncbi:hypothetical protein OG417_49325 [Actinoallomurus sp. NBC_01490]|uniref:hypothetical protein n=1 Tax=Actinoallomurus sp. NBC_01490 TaxID=2903557 RepID=UPI002E30D219|nr:hypothetical protein [Actinoallomurus sp. NBC_01490]